MKLYAFFNLTINGGGYAVLQTNYFISKEKTQVPHKRVCPRQRAVLNSIAKNTICTQSKKLTLNFGKF